MTGRHSLGLFTLICLVVANMIGAGVFTTSGYAMADLGDPILVLCAWLAGGILAVCGAMSYGALARLRPLSGGEYLYLSRNIHPLAGFIAGWISLVAGFTGAIAAAALGLEVYLLPLLPVDALPENVLATLAICLVALLHGRQVGQGALVQNGVVILKLVLIVGFIVIGGLIIGLHKVALSGLPENPTGISAFSLSAFAVTLMWVSFSYSGFNAATYIAGEARDPVSTVPRAMLIATVIVMALYLLLNAFFVLAPEAETIAGRGDVAAVAAAYLGGDALAGLVRAIIILALATSVSAMIMAGPRVYARMADDGLLPRCLGLRESAAPGLATALQALLAIVVVWISSLRELLSYLGMTLSISAAVTVGSLFILVKRTPGSGASLPGYPWAPMIYVSFTLLFVALAALRTPVQMLAALLTILSGVAVYLLLNRRRESV
ncbi:MAG: amino acid permease [Gammaproteobacteria bacterium]|nr:MAG: amino acid permease [Gammaproteobacteria bacterium]